LPLQNALYKIMQHISIFIKIRPLTHLYRFTVEVALPCSVNLYIFEKLIVCLRLTVQFTMTWDSTLFVYRVNYSGPSIIRTCWALSGSNNQKVWIIKAHLFMHTALLIYSNITYTLYKTL